MNVYSKSIPGRKGNSKHMKYATYMYILLLGLDMIMKIDLIKNRLKLHQLVP